jgi:hypothetical protein
MDRKRTTNEVIELVKSVGWQIDEIRIASTQSIYIDIRRKNEWCTIRVSDHKQVYHKWLTTYSIAHGDLWFEDLEEILSKPYGEVGDLL